MQLIKKKIEEFQERAVTMIMTGIKVKTKGVMKSISPPECAFSGVCEKVEL